MGYTTLYPSDSPYFSVVSSVYVLESGVVKGKSMT